MARREAEAAVMTSLARLPEEQRIAVRMHYMEGRPAQDVAATLGKSSEAAYMLMRRGLKAMRQFLGSASQFLTR